ncbi:hypothetical protein GCM10020218_058230 [Dactylosporangium vinaceum]
MPDVRGHERLTAGDLHESVEASSRGGFIEQTDGASCCSSEEEEDSGDRRAEDGDGARPAVPQVRTTGRGGGGAVYGLGFIGALVYYIQQAGGSGWACWACSKRSCAAFLVYDVLKHLAG